MEAGVVAIEAGVGVYRENGGDNLGSEKEKNGNIERSAGDLKFFVEIGLDGPGRSNKNSDEIDKHHLVELENFGGEGPED